MTGRSAWLFALLAIAMALLTWLLGWWTVAVSGAVAGALAWRRGGRPWLTALSAAVAWGALLLGDALDGRFGALASMVSGVIRIPAGMLIAVSLLFAALLAWSGAVVGSEVARLAARRRSPE